MNFISAGLKKPAPDEMIDDDSDEDEKPVVKQEEIPKEYVPKKLRTVSWRVLCVCGCSLHS